MELKNFFAQDDVGNFLSEATCYVYQRGTESLAGGLMKANGLAKANPFTTDQKGFAEFAAPNGLYDVRVVKDARDFRIRLQFNDVSETAAAVEAAAVRAESARDAAVITGGIKDDIAHGLATTSPGENFQVLSPISNEYVILYKNKGGGVADPLDTYPSAKAVQTLESDFRKVFTSAVTPDLLVSIMDKLGFATWLQARESDGGPSDHSKALLRKGMPGLPEIGDVPGTGVSIQDEAGRKTWLQTSSGDGGPTPFAAECVRRSMVGLIPGLPEIGDVPGTGVSIQDEAGRKTWLQTSSEDGGPTPFATECIRRALGVLPTATDIGYIAEGDSMTAGSHGGGVPYPTTLATLLGKPITNVGVSGSTAVEIAIRAGGVIPLLTIPDGVIPATTDPVTITWDITGSLSGTVHPVRVYAGKVRGIPCSLNYTPATGLVTLNRITAGTALPVGSPVPFITDAPHISKRHIVWAGRNDYPKTPAYAPVDKLLARIEYERSPYLLVSVCNMTSEPAGSAGYADVVALNLLLLKRAPLAYVDLRGRMIREGLALAGLTATASDTTAIAEDRIPPALIEDGLHFNAAGRLACAHIIYNELVLRNMA